jgi:UDP-N-acetylmuramyl tripeptide synthase
MDHPSHELYVIGITGTNGKTTVAHLIGKALESAGYKPFVLGTLNSGNRNLSTPEPQDILTFMTEHLKQGGTHFVMEVTSEGIDQSRILGIDFDLKILTNITHDHLDYHKTFELYRNVKLGFMAEGPAHTIYPDDFHGEIINYTTQLMGDFNVLNIKAAAVALRHIGIAENTICDALSSCLPPRGRLEGVENGQPFLVLVDYAHTPDGLENVLKTAKKMAIARKGKLLVLFGCGGNRDCEKRPKMGRVASTIADHVVITNDNPRLENPSSIIAEIVGGLPIGFKSYTVLEDRKSAIQFIIDQTEDRDVVILAGKGHETYQILATETIHFDDREEAMSALLIRAKAAVGSTLSMR